jgi:predicted transcriptional regulator
MMARRKDPKHVSVRLLPNVIARLDAIADTITPTGSTPNRSAVVRAAILEGLATLEARQNKEGSREPGEASRNRESNGG